MSALVDFIYFSLSLSLSLPAYEYDEGIQKRCACVVCVFCLLISLIVNQRRIRKSYCNRDTDQSMCTPDRTPRHSQNHGLLCG